ncbi:MAG: hypothetical protein B7Z55_08575, partial [Planctomycetales bacterium 12-60-4]
MEHGYCAPATLLLFLELFCDPRHRLASFNEPPMFVCVWENRSMTISVSCPECGKTLKAKSEMAGKRVRCPKCQHAFVLTDPEGVEDIRSLESDGTGDLDFPDLSESPDRGKPSTADDDDLIEFPTGTSRKPVSKSPEADSTGDDLAQFRAVKPRTGKRIETIPDEPPAPPKKRARFQMAGACAVLVLFIPLAVSILFPGPDPYEQLAEIFREHPEVQAQVEAATSREEMLAALPGGRFPGAHLAHDSLWHWGYAIASMLAYWGVLGVLWREKTAGPGKLLITGVVTGTLGIFVLLAFQYLAFVTQGVLLRGRGIVMLFFLIIKFIGYSYVCAEDPNSSLLGSFMGFTC